MVTVYNSGHFGAIGHYAMQAAQQDMVGVCFTGAGLSVVPTFAAKPLLGTNPIALAAPARHEAPMLFDAATSAIAGNKIRLAIRVGSPLLPGWVTDKDGTPIMEEKPVFDRDEFYQAPLGGTREQGSHKGYGFALMAEVLSTMLAGALPTMLAPGSGSKNHFAAYNIEAFTDLEQFKDSMDEMLRTLRTAQPAPGQERVLYPGLSEAEEIDQRRAHGIPLHKEVIAVVRRVRPRSRPRATGSHALSEDGRRRPAHRRGPVRRRAVGAGIRAHAAAARRPRLHAVPDGLVRAGVPRRVAGARTPGAGGPRAPDRAVSRAPRSAARTSRSGRDRGVIYQSSVEGRRSPRAGLSLAASPRSSA